MENPLWGKKISCNGDSICEGVGYEGGYAKIIAERNNMQWQNIGIGDGWHPNEEGYKKYYCDKIEAWLKTL